MAQVENRIALLEAQIALLQVRLERQGATDRAGPLVNKDDLHPKRRAQLAKTPWLAPPSPSIVLTDVNVVDTRNGKIIPDQCVHIADGKIQTISSAINDLAARRISLRGRYLCPGLIDCHVHVGVGAGIERFEEGANQSEALRALRSTYVVRQILARGFTTVRDCGGTTKDFAQALEQNLICGPRMYQCGQVLSQTGGHNDHRPLQNFELNGDVCCGGVAHWRGRICDGVPSCLSATRDTLRRGADFIKIMGSGGVSSLTDKLESVQFTAEELQAITTVCKNMGDYHSTGHAYTNAAIRQLVDNGVKGIEHASFLDKGTAEYMARKGIFLTATLATLIAGQRDEFKDWLAPISQAKVDQVQDANAKALKYADDAGVTIVFGSDMMGGVQTFQTMEFELQGQVLPAHKVLRHATINAAKLLRMEGKLGEIVPGAIADLIVLEQNPLEDITVLDRHEENLLAVLREGHTYFSKMPELKVDMFTDLLA